VVRLGQNFLADPNLLDAIVRDAGLAPEDVVLEVGAGEGVLTGRLAVAASHVHVVEIDRGLEGALAEVASDPKVTLHWGDAMKVDFSALDPAPTAVVSNLPYAVATPVILRTVEQLPSVREWTVMVQREIADPALLDGQIKHVVLHEVAHHFGISDQRLVDIDRY